MSLFDILEGRMQQIFEGGNSMAPLPFKKLAKQAVREMKKNTVKVDGRQIAPTLYTVMVSSADDAVIAPLYQQVTDELVDFVAHEAQNLGLTLMAAPMVRFIAAPFVKQGKMEVVAEVVTHEVLESLRAEEAAFVQHRATPGRAGGRAAMRPARPGQAAPAAMPAPQPPRQAPVAPLPQPPAAPQPVPAPAPAPQPQPQPVPAPPSTCELVDRTSGRTWRIGVPSTVIGRDEAVADLVLNDTNVSRKHAELAHDAGGWRIADLGSTNGTRVNGARIDQTALTSGDTITVGLMTLEFREL